ncbi:MAG TPA: hypothetical protein O0X27_06615 [Methanocorpusculum sp.]|nr:hypothetical protein [Methanocorpusculum sp.]
MMKEKATETVAMRFTPTELKNIADYVETHGGGKVTDWMRTLIRQTVNGIELGTTAVSRPLTVIDQILQNEEAADLIYQIVAEKLRLPDLRAELAAFSRRAPAASLEDLDADLRATAARMAAVPQDPVDPAEIIVHGEIHVDLEWNREWKLPEFLALSDEERQKHEFYLMVLINGKERIPYYFWHVHDDFTAYLSKHNLGGHEIVIYGAEYSILNRSHGNIDDLRIRLVEIVRYAARDSNIGRYEMPMKDVLLRNYFVQNSGIVPPGLPCEFTFSWVSDTVNAGKADYATKDAAVEAMQNRMDGTYRPVVECRWHYTDEEREKRNLSTKVSFDEQAVPKQMRRYLAY